MEQQLKVIMVGPHRSVHGGISGVVNGYYEAGLHRKVHMKYIGTMKEGGKVKKLLVAAAAYMRFLLVLPFYDIVHIHMASDNSYRRKSVFVRTAAFFKKRIIIHQHGGDIKKFYAEQLSHRGRESMRRTLNLSDVFLVLTPEWKDFFRELVDEKKIQILPNGICITPVEEKEYGVHKLLFLGRLCRDKGLAELFSCVQRVSGQFPDVRLYLGGIWEDRTLEKEAKRYAERIGYLGWLEGEFKKDMLRLCDIYVLPSYYEGQPVSVLEAMASGCAVVASNVGGIPDMIRDGSSGILVEPGNETALETALVRVLSDPELCRSMGEQAKQQVRDSFSLEKILERLISIYETITLS